MALSPSEKMKALRERKKAAGLVKCELWVTPTNSANLKAFESEMQKAEIASINFVRDVYSDDEIYDAGWLNE